MDVCIEVRGLCEIGSRKEWNQWKEWMECNKENEINLIDVVNIYYIKNKIRAGAWS